MKKFSKEKICQAYLKKSPSPGPEMPGRAGADGRTADDGVAYPGTPRPRPDRVEGWQARGGGKKSLQHLDLSLHHKRQVIDMLSRDYPVTLVCDVVGCARSSYYYQAEQPDETELKAAIETVAAEWPTYDYRRVTAQLRRQGRVVNHKRVRHLMREMGLQAKIKRKGRKTTNSEHSFPRYPNLVQELEIVRPDQVWVSDITYIRLRNDFAYLAVIMDVFTRRIRGWHLGRTLDQSLTLIALQRALAHHTPEIHHSDQGVQYAATAYTRMLQEANVQISMAQAGEAWQNGYAERLIRTIKEEEVDLSDYEDYTDALQQMGRFLDEVYTQKRIHSSLGYLTPAEFESQWRTTQVQTLDVHQEPLKSCPVLGGTSTYSLL